MPASGFYKSNEEKTALFYAPNAVHSRDYSLIASDKASYQYPVEGWTWYESKEDALTVEGVTEPEKPTAPTEAVRPAPGQRPNRNSIAPR
jgi:hypothetical protein